MLPIKRILHPTDFTDQSRAAFEVACLLARDYSAELIVMHVYSSGSVYVPDGIAMQVPGDDAYEVRKRLYEIHPSDSRVSIQHVLVEGNPIDQILQQARSDSVDLIVMGTHGISGFTRMLMGSVSESMARRASCPVLTLRKPLQLAREAAPAAMQASVAIA